MVIALNTQARKNLANQPKPKPEPKPAPKPATREVGAKNGAQQAQQAQQAQKGAKQGQQRAQQIALAKAQAEGKYSPALDQAGQYITSNMPEDVSNALSVMPLTLPVGAALGKVASKAGSLPPKVGLSKLAERAGTQVPQMGKSLVEDTTAIVTKKVMEGQTPEQIASRTLAWAKIKLDLEAAGQAAIKTAGLSIPKAKAAASGIIEQAGLTAGKQTINTKSILLAVNYLNKVTSAAGIGLGAVGLYAWGKWSKAEGLDSLTFAKKEALSRGDTKSATEISSRIKEIVGDGGWVESLKDINIFRNFAIKLEGDIRQNEETDKTIEEQEAQVAEGSQLLARDVAPLMEQGWTAKEAEGILSGKGYDYQRWLQKQQQDRQDEVNAYWDYNRRADELQRNKDDLNKRRWAALSAADRAAADEEMRQFWTDYNAKQQLSEEQNRQFWAQYEADKEAYWEEYRRKKQEEAPSKLTFGLL